MTVIVYCNNTIVDQGAKVDIDPEQVSHSEDIVQIIFNFQFQFQFQLALLA